MERERLEKQDQENEMAKREREEKARIKRENFQRERTPKRQPQITDLREYIDPKFRHLAPTQQLQKNYISPQTLKKLPDGLQGIECFTQKLTNQITRAWIVHPKGILAYSDEGKFDLSALMIDVVDRYWQQGRAPLNYHENTGAFLGFDLYVHWINSQLK